MNEKLKLHQLHFEVVSDMPVCTAFKLLSNSHFMGHFTILLYCASVGLNSALPEESTDLHAIPFVCVCERERVRVRE